MKFWRKKAQNTELNSSAEEKKKKRLRLPLRAYLYYALVLSIALTGVTFSRYISTSNMQGNVQVASFIVTSTGEFSEASIGRQHDNTTTCTFTVSNVDANGNVCEVSAKYCIQIVIGSDIVAKWGPLNITVDGVECKSFEDNADGTRTLIFKSEAYSFDAGEAKTTSHEILIGVDVDHLNSATVGDNVCVYAYVEQVIGS